MSLQTDLRLRPDSTLDAKWSDFDLLRIFQPNGLSTLWNELVRTGELAPINVHTKGKKVYKTFCHFSCQARAGEGDQHQEELAHD